MSRDSYLRVWAYKWMCVCACQKLDLWFILFKESLTVTNELKLLILLRCSQSPSLSYAHGMTHKHSVYSTVTRTDTQQQKPDGYTHQSTNCGDKQTNTVQFCRVPSLLICSASTQTHSCFCQDLKYVATVSQLILETWDWFKRAGIAPSAPWDMSHGGV